MALIPMAIAFRLIYFLVSFLNKRTVSSVPVPEPVYSFWILAGFGLFSFLSKEKLK
jgi:hypothetical protein